MPLYGSAFFVAPVRPKVFSEPGNWIAPGGNSAFATFSASLVASLFRPWYFLCALDRSLYSLAGIRDRSNLGLTR